MQAHAATKACVARLKLTPPLPAVRPLGIWTLFRGRGPLVRESLLLARVCAWCRPVNHAANILPLVFDFPDGGTCWLGCIAEYPMSVFLCLTAVLVVLVLKHPLWNVQMSISSRAVAVAFRRSVGATRPGALRPLLGSQVNRYVGGSQTDYVGLQSPHFGQRRGVSSTHPALDTAGPAPAQERLYEDPRIQILEAALAQVAKHG